MDGAGVCEVTAQHYMRHTSATAAPWWNHCNASVKLAPHSPLLVQKLTGGYIERNMRLIHVARKRCCPNRFGCFRVAKDTLNVSPVVVL